VGVNELERNEIAPSPRSGRASPSFGLDLALLLSVDSGVARLAVASGRTDRFLSWVRPVSARSFSPLGRGCVVVVEVGDGDAGQVQVGVRCTQVADHRRVVRLPALDETLRYRRKGQPRPVLLELSTTRQWAPESTQRSSSPHSCSRSSRGQLCRSVDTPTGTRMLATRPTVSHVR
jgi:hypothetical protein